MKIGYSCRGAIAEHENTLPKSDEPYEKTCKPALFTERILAVETIA